MAYPMPGQYRTSYSRNYNATSKPKPPVTPTVPANYTQTYTDLMAYSGTFGFVLEMRSVMLKYGKLSDKQWAAVAKCLQPPKALTGVSGILVDKCDIPVTISASAARYLAKTNNWPFNPCTFRITQIKDQTLRKGITIRAVVDWSGSVSVCRCCGKSLTDWRSQATGVGPVCVKNTGIPYVTNKQDIARFQKQMELLCKNMGEVEFFLKNWHIKAGQADINAALANINANVVVQKTASAATPPPLTSEPNTITIPIDKFEWLEDVRELRGKTSLISEITNWQRNKGQYVLPAHIVVHNKQTGKSVDFVAMSGKPDENEYMSSGAWDIRIILTK